MLLTQIPLTLSLVIRLYYQSLPAGLPDYISCPCIAVVDKFLVGQHLHVSVKGSIRECHYWVYPYIFCSILQVLFIVFRWFLRWEVGGYTTAVLCYDTSRICSICLIKNWYSDFTLIKGREKYLLIIKSLHRNYTRLYKNYDRQTKRKGKVS